MAKSPVSIFPSYCKLIPVTMRTEVYVVDDRLLRLHFQLSKQSRGDHRARKVTWTVLKRARCTQLTVHTEESHLRLSLTCLRCPSLSCKSFRSLSPFPSVGTCKWNQVRKITPFKCVWPSEHLSAADGPLICYLIWQGI